MSGRPAFANTGHMPRYILEHRHAPRECGVVFASFNAFESPLRHREVSATCSFGTHRIWWELEAADGSRGSIAVAALRGGANHRHSRSARSGALSHPCKFRVSPDVREGVGAGTLQRPPSTRRRRDGDFNHPRNDCGQARPSPGCVGPDASVRRRRLGRPRAAWRLARDPPRPVRRRDGPVGLRQVDADAHPRRPRYAYVGQGVGGRRGDHRHGRRRADAPASSQHRLHLPVLQPAPDADRAAERRAAAVDRRSRTSTPNGSTR